MNKNMIDEYFLKTKKFIGNLEETFSKSNF